VKETADDLARVQDLLDQSYASAGAHLRSIHTADRRFTAEELAERLTGMCLLTLATTTSDGRPITGPVDGVFHRGDWWFGSAPNSLRARHIERDPRVSVTHVPGEHLGVVTHGRVADTRIASDLPDDVQHTMVEIYGETWHEWGSGAVYWRLEAERMFTFHMDSAGT